MSVRLMAEVWSRYSGGGSKKLVLLAIADNANDEGEAWPAVDLIALKCGISDRHVQGITAELKAEGWLRIAPPTETRLTNTYWVCIPEDAPDRIAERKRQIIQRKIEQGVNPASPGEPQFTPPPAQGVNPSSPKPSVIVTTAKAVVTAAAGEAVNLDFGSPSSLQGESSSPKEPGLTDGQREFLAAFGAKRFKTAAQRKTIRELEERHGIEALKGKIGWAAKKGMSMGDAVVAIESALDRPKQSGGAARAKVQNPGKAGRTVIPTVSYGNGR